MNDRRLIESRLPLKKISEESAREKSIRHGHISTLHIWWARRPLAASRAAVFGTLVPDTDENYELVEKIVPWDAVKDGNNPDVLRAREEVLKTYGGRPPRVLDPFAGGGAIPLEALRLGADTYAADLNPVAYLILKATLEYPQKFGQPGSRPVPEYIKDKDRQKENKAASTTNGEQQELLKSEGSWEASYKANPLATDVRYWGEWVLERAREELAEFYPPDPDGKTPVAYLWARTVTCTNPACRAEVPLVRQWWLAKKKNKRIALKPIVDKEAKKVSFEVVDVSEHETWPDKGTVQRGNAICPVCGNTMPVEHIREVARKEEWGERLLAVVLSSGGEGKTYRVADQQDVVAFERAREKLTELEGEHKGPLSLVPNEPLPPVGTLGFRVNLYGIKKWGQLFNPRQALALVTFAKWVREAHKEILKETEDEEYAKAIGTYLALIHDNIVHATNVLTRWIAQNEAHANTFSRQALSMIWDYTEIAPTTLERFVKSMYDAIVTTSTTSVKKGLVIRTSAARLPYDDAYFDAIITDPPYYDAVPYADLSDFFYVWLRRTVGHLYPEHFRTPLTPKAQEIVQNPVRHDGDNERAKAFFENMMKQAFAEMHRVLKPEGRATIVFAHKSTEAWETLISALINAGFVVEASWPIHTERPGRLRAHKSAALASSTFLVCRKRTSANTAYLNRVLDEMEKAIEPKLEAFWNAGISGADFFMSAIGPGLEAYSKYQTVKRMSGEVVGVGEFLDEVRKIVLRFVLKRIFGNGGREASVDGPTQFALAALWSYGYEMPSDEARKLAQSTGVELSELGSLVQVKGEKTRILKAKEREKRDPHFGLPDREGADVPVIDALQRATLLLGRGREAIAEYLHAVGHLKNEIFWLTAQAIAEVLEGEDEGRALHELLTFRDNLPEPQGQPRLFGGEG